MVAKAGSRVQGIVSERKKAGGFGRGGKLEIKINSFKTINNVEVPLEFTQMTTGKEDIGGIVIGAAVSLVGGFLMKGKNAVIEKGTKFKAEVTSDTDLGIKLRNLSQISEK